MNKKSQKNKKLNKKIIHLYFKMIYLLNFKVAVLSNMCCQSCVGMTTEGEIYFHEGFRVIIITANR
jgi:hypothetical protein